MQQKSSPTHTRVALHGSVQNTLSDTSTTPRMPTLNSCGWTKNPTENLFGVHGAFPPCVPQQFCSFWAPKRNSVCNPYCLSTKTLTGPCLSNNSFTSQGSSDYFLRALAAVAPSGCARLGPVWVCLVHTAPVSPHGHVCWDISHQPHYLKLETSTPKREKTVEV